MRKLLPWTIVLCGVAPALAQPDKLFEAKTYRYTGGEYQAETFAYRLMKPAKIDPGQTYPLVLLLHGAGERGTDNRRQVKYFGDWMARPEMRRKYPCFVLAPQCRPRKRWEEVNWAAKTSTPMAKAPGDQMKVALAVLRKTVHEEPVDTSRVYLTGLSMGGYGAWHLALRHPDWFAAVVPVCGGGDERQAKRLTGVPLWAFHGDKDTAVPVVRTRTMIDAIKAAGGHPKYTEYAGAGHNVWSRAYSDSSGLAEWLFAQRSAKPVTFPPAPKEAPAPPLSPGLAALIATDAALRKGERIAFLGDSITQAGARPGGYVTLIREALAEKRPDLGATVIPAGISGHKVPNLQSRLDRDVIAKKATVCWIYIGINDVWHSLRKRGTPKDKYEAGLRDLIARLHKSGALVVLATPSVIGETPGGANPLDAMLDEYSAISRKVAADTGVTMCDLRKAFQAELNKRGAKEHKGVLTSDGVHLNAAGNRFVADQAARAIAEALKKRK